MGACSLHGTPHHSEDVEDKSFKLAPFLVLRFV